MAGKFFQPTRPGGVQVDTPSVEDVGIAVSPVEELQQGMAVPYPESMMVTPDEEGMREDYADYTSMYDAPPQVYPETPVSTSDELFAKVFSDFKERFPNEPDDVLKEASRRFLSSDSGKSYEQALAESQSAFNARKQRAEGPEDLGETAEQFSQRIARELATDPGRADQPNLQAQGSASMLGIGLGEAGLTEREQQLEEQNVAAMDIPSGEFDPNVPGSDQASLAEKLRLKQEQDERIRTAAQRPGAIDYTSMEELNTLGNKVLKETEKGTVQQGALDIKRSLSKTTIEPNGALDPTENSQTGMELLAGLLRTDTVNALGAITNGIISAGREVQKYRDAIEGGASPMEAAESFMDLSMEADEQAVVERGTEIETFGDRIALAAKKFLVNQDIGQGGDGSKYRDINPKQIRDLSASIALDTPYFAQDKDSNGNDIIIPTPGFGIPLLMAGRKLVDETISDKKLKMGRRTTLPYRATFQNAVFKKISSKFKSKYSSSNKNSIGSSKTIDTYLERTGSVRYTTTDEQVAGVSLLTALTSISYNLPAETRDTSHPDYDKYQWIHRAGKLIQMDHARFDNMAEAIGGGEKGERHKISELANTIEEVNDSLETYTDIKHSGMSETNQSSMDPVVLRIYSRNRAVEGQNNLTNRKLLNNAAAEYHAIDNKVLNRIFADDMPQRSHDYFLKHWNTGIKDRDMQILSPLMAIQKNIENATNKAHEAKHWIDRVKELTRDQIAGYAETGRNLKSALRKLGVADTSGPDVIKRFGLQLDAEGKVIPIQLPQFTEGERTAIQRWINISDKKTAGFILTSFLDAADFVAAAQNNTRWKSRVMTEMDMNSAGRTFLAFDVANRDVLKRTGILWKNYYTENNATTQAHGGPRDYFANIVKEMLVNDSPYHVNRIFTDYNGTPLEKRALAADIAKVMTELSSVEGNKFADDFAKKVLLVDDYGMPVMMHQGNAQKFLFDHREQFDPILRKYYDGNHYDMINDFARIYQQALVMDSSRWQKNLPKHMAEFLQMFGRFPQPIMMFGENASIGSQTYREVAGAETIVNVGDRQVVVPKFEANPVLNTLMRGKHKTGLTAYNDMMVEDKDGNLYRVKKGEKFDYFAREGSAVINQVGPILGQYRESAVLIHTIADMEKWTGREFVASVHDNIIVDGNSYARMHFAANDARKGAAQKVLRFDMMKQFIDDYDRQFQEIKAELEKNINGTIDIGRNSKYGLLGVKAQEVKRTLETMDANDSRRDYFVELNKIFSTIAPNMPSTGDIKNYKINTRNLLVPVSFNIKNPGEASIEAKAPAFTALTILWDMDNAIKKFTSDKSAHVKLRNMIMEDMAEQELLAFLT